MADPDPKSPNGDHISPNGDNQDEIADFVAAGARLKEAAEFNGFNQAKLAQALGTTTSSIGRYWHGKRLLPTELIFRVGDLLSVNPRWLATGVGSPRPPIETASEVYNDEMELIGTFRTLGERARSHILETARLLMDMTIPGYSERFNEGSSRSTSEALHSPHDDFRSEEKD